VESELPLSTFFLPGLRCLLIASLGVYTAFQKLIFAKFQILLFFFSFFSHFFCCLNFFLQFFKGFLEFFWSFFWRFFGVFSNAP